MDRITDVLSHVKSDDSLALVASALQAALGGAAANDDDDDEMMEILDEGFSSRPQLQASPPPGAVRQRRRSLPIKTNKRGASQSRSMVGSPKSVDIDSWKYGGREFSKKSSQVGPQHQATKLPKAGSLNDKKNLGSDQ